MNKSYNRSTRKTSPTKNLLHSTHTTAFNTTQTSYLHGDRQLNRPIYLCTKPDQQVYPNTFHTFHQDFRPGRRQIQQKYESRALTKSCLDRKVYGDLLIPANKKRKFEQSYVVTDPLTDSLWKKQSVKKEEWGSKTGRRWRDEGINAKESFKWRY